MSTTPVPTSIRPVRAAIAASSGNGEASCRAKWCTRTYAPSTPSSSAATASSTLCTSASRPVRTCDPGMGCQCPKDRNPIRFSPALMSLRARERRHLFPPTTKAPAGHRWGPSHGVRLLLGLVLRLGEGADAVALVLEGGRVAGGPAAVLAVVLGREDDVLRERVRRAG